MVEPEEDRKQYRKRDGQKHILDGDFPEMDEPAPVLSREEGGARRQALQVHALHPPHVDEPREEDDRQRRAVVLEEDAHVVMEQRALAELAAGIRDGEDQHGHHDAQVEGLGVALQHEDLDALLEVDEGDVEAEDVAGEAGDVAQPVARVRDGEDPVQDEGPQADPAHEGEVVDARGHHDVVDGVVEDGDGPRHADDDERLAGDEGEDDGAEDGRQEHLIDAVLRVRAREHVQGEGHGREDAVGRFLVSVAFPSMPYRSCRSELSDQHDGCTNALMH